MAHIFFEHLENRRSTQSLVTNYTIQDQEWHPAYGVFYPLPEESTPVYEPISPIGYYIKSPVYNPIGPFNPYSPVWSNPLGSYSVPWNNTSSIFGGIGGFIFPFWNNFRTIFQWDPTPIKNPLPKYPDPEDITPIFQPMYGISIDPILTDPIFTTTTYSPPSPPFELLYGINPPSNSNNLHL